MLKAETIDGGPFMGSSFRFWDAYYTYAAYKLNATEFFKIQQYANPYIAIKNKIMMASMRHAKFMGFPGSV